jgi:predicted N-acetyltransferase YhbS
MNYSIRPARPDEAGLLSDLAIRSKATWGYDQKFMAAVRRHLTWTPEQVSERPVFVLELGGRIVGFGSLLANGVDVELSDLWVEPSFMRRGCGRTLWRHACDTARSMGHRRILITSDPFAEPFYVAMGAVRIGDVPSDAVPGHMLPLMQMELT